MNVGTILILCVVSSMAPIGVLTIAARRPTLKWQELLLIGGVTMLPALTVLAVQNIIRPMSATIVLGLITGHILTHLDDD